MTLITGTFRSPAGSLLPLSEVAFAPRPLRIRSLNGALVFPSEVTATADESAQVSVTLVAGDYSGRMLTSGGVRAFRITVPDAAQADLAVLLGETRT